MSSVSAWATLRGYDYQFIDDSFFTYAPDWFREAVNEQRHLVSDFARLELAHRFLTQGWGRVIWVDADVLVCDPQNFCPDEKQSFLFCWELWVTVREKGIFFSERVNNSVFVFCQGNKFLDFYRHACERIVQSKKNLHHAELGTKFLTGIPHLPLIRSSVIFSPLLLVSFYRNDRAVIDEYLRRLSVPIHAVNLCLTFKDTTHMGLVLDDDVFLAIIRNLQSMGYKNDL